MFFLRKSSLERLPVAMTGVRMGERALQIGLDDPSLVGALAAKVGMSGLAAIAVRTEADAVRARAAASQAGALAEVTVTPFSALPFEAGSFDVIVLHANRVPISMQDTEAAATLREGYRLLRAGGRLVIVEGGARKSPLAFLRSAPKLPDIADGVRAVGAAGFRAARLLAEHEGYRFTEGLK